LIYSEIRQREGKEREQILNEDGRDIRWMKEIWKRRERIEKEWGWIVGIKKIIFGIVILCLLLFMCICLYCN
jgi:hypothetical protein